LGLLYLHLYNKTYIRNSLYVFDNWGKNLSHAKVQFNYSKKMFNGKAKLIRLIGDPDEQLPNNWSSAVISVSFEAGNRA
jgi:hypothetical protein